MQTLRVPTGASEQEEVQVEVTRLLVECYFDIVRANLQDAVPKAVMHFLILHVQRGLQQHLIRSLYRYVTGAGGFAPVLGGVVESGQALVPYKSSLHTHLATMSRSRVQSMG